MQPFQTHYQRATSNYILPSRASEMSLFEKLLPSPSAYTVDEFFPEQVDPKKRKLIEATKAQRSMPSESFASDWGNNSIYNQPRSHVAPLPPDGISAFDAYLERRSYQAERYPLRSPKRVANGPVRSKLPSRAPSSDRGFDNQEWKVVPPLHGNAGLVSAMRVKSDSQFDANITWIGTIGTYE
ncbi:uncharacterized protein K489DRAFT_176578 [Dissoconium aciculare CBS 342.82]|uniref:Uncharacterized protein n=1 Tax=Dissoconium aciculare CBS 342.82 TaxID=1314786 RepID=A0A6J3MBI7_9PEZI|nr:uncharacterized protein K489DRAFT_176578 [Dissoconium aciculare CBS 342.82]KAF1824202.1 hypothetical protein K489DRAFT_176578 [Dissoconium aciculare CBS 342.82]